jgi:hypothetical protein
MYGGVEGKLCMLTSEPNVSFMLWPLCHLGNGGGQVGPELFQMLWIDNIYHLCSCNP